MEIVFTRHTSVDVPTGTCYGWTDVPLKDTFEQEAAVTKERLDKMGTFDVVYSSPLSRARRLATFCGYPNHIPDNRLMEINMGDWEMKYFDDISDPRLQQWYDDFLHVEPTGGECFETFYLRVASFLDELRQKDYRRVGVFAHGGVLLCAGIYAGLYTVDECLSHHAEYGCSEVINLSKT